MNPFANLRRIRGHTVWIGPLCPDSWIVDAGAHRGEFSEEVHRLCGARTLLIEANPILASALKPPPRGEIVQAALSAMDGTADFIFSRNAEGGGITGASEDPLGESQEVETISLETVFTRLGTKPIDLLKLDIEGSEFELIEKTPDAILRGINQITVEFHEFLPTFANRRLFDKARKRLESLGFACFVMTLRGRGDVLFLNSARISLPPTKAYAWRFLGPWIIKLRERLGHA